MNVKMTKSEKTEAVKRVVCNGESIKNVVKELKKTRKISIAELEDWVFFRVGMFSAKDRSKAVSRILNNGENIELVSSQTGIPEELLVLMIKHFKKTRSLENLEIYHEGIRRDDFKGNIYKRFTMDIGVKLNTIKLTEVIYREFLSENENIFFDSSEAKSIGEKHNINLNYVDKETSYNHISLNHLVIIHECFDNYLKNIYKIIKDCSAYNFQEKKDKETILDCVLKNTNLSSEKNCDEYKICNYYRLVRNANIHDSNVEKAPFIEVTLPNGVKVKPNDFSNINYTDADIFATTIIKYGEIIYKSLNIDIEKYIVSRDLYNKLELGRYDVDKRKRRLVRYLDTIFPYEKSDISKTVELYLKSL